MLGYILLYRSRRFTIAFVDVNSRVMTDRRFSRFESGITFRKCVKYVYSACVCRYKYRKTVALTADLANAVYDSVIYLGYILTIRKSYK